MIRRLLLVAIILAILAFFAGLLLAAQTVGVEAWHDSALPQSAFVAVLPSQGTQLVLAQASHGPSGINPTAFPSAADTSTDRRGDAIPVAASAAVRSAIPAASMTGPVLSVAPSARRPNVSVGVTQPSAGITGFDKAPTATAISKPSSVGALTGQATWFAYVPGDAAAGPALREALGPNWRGTVVTVTSGGRQVWVTLLGWCACQPPTRLLDLDVRAFSVLADPAMGVIPVEVAWP